MLDIDKSKVRLAILYTSIVCVIWYHISRKQFGTMWKILNKKCRFLKFCLGILKEIIIYGSFFMLKKYINAC